MLQRAEQYFYRKGTSEVKEFASPSKYSNTSIEKDGILTYTGRMLPTDSVTIIGKATQRMLDLQSTSFCVPILEKSSPIAYSIVNDIHWNHPTASHSGVETTWRYVLQKVFIIEGRSLVKSIRSTCERCRYLLKKTIDVSMGPVSPDNLMIAPIFFVSQVDLCGPFQSYSYHNKRATVKIWYVVFCCATTTTINIKCMEDYSTSAFLQAFTRFSCEVGYPRRLLADEGSQLVKGCETVQFDFQDIQRRLFKDSNVEFDTCPVGGHNMNGLVERKIREVKKSIEKSVSNQKLSIMQWETFASRAANSINDLPLGIRDYDGDLQSLDIITPNRLKLGRNNNRSPTGEFKLSDNSSKLIQQNQEIFDSWFELWLVSHVPGLIPNPKRFKSDINLKKGDVVLFTKQDSPIRSNYQFGIFESIEVGRDDKVRKVRVRYQNASESVHRFTKRSVRSLVVIHRVDETSVMMDLFNANKVATCGGAV